MHKPIVYTESNAYKVLETDVLKNFHQYAKIDSNDVKLICIVGAHQGIEIETFLNNYKNSNIIAFEAYKPYYDLLVQNWEKAFKVHTYNLAISNESGVIPFYQVPEGMGSILKFQADKFGHPYRIEKIFDVRTTTLKEFFGNREIDLLWVDVQGAELKVLQGANLSKIRSMFLEINTHDYIKEWDKEPYLGQCYQEDLEDYLKDTHYLFSIGLDNANKNGQGNSFWLRNNL